MLMCFAFALSSAFGRTNGASVLMFAVFVIVLPMTDGYMMAIAEQKPWFSPSFASGIIKHSLNPTGQDEFSFQNNELGMFFNYHLPDTAQSLYVMGGYAVLAGLLSVFLLKRRQFV